MLKNKIYRYCYFFKIAIVALDIAAVVIFRIYIKTKVFPTNSVGGVIIGDVGSTVINTILIVGLNKVLKFIKDFLKLC